MAGVTHALGHLRVLLARSQGRAKHEERRLCAVSGKNVEVLRGVIEVGSVVERDGDQTATVVGVHAGVGDDEVTRLLRHAAVDGATRHNARLHRGDAVLAPLLHIADGGKQQARVRHLDAAGNLGRLLCDVLGLVGAVDELEDVALAQLVGAHIDRLAVDAQRVGVACASLEHIGNLAVSADGDEVARNRRRIAAAHDFLHRKTDGQLADFAIDGARHGTVRVPQRATHAQQRHGGNTARSHAQKLAARDTGAVVLRGKVSRRAIPTLTMMSGARDRLHARGVVRPARRGVCLARAYGILCRLLTAPRTPGASRGVSAIGVRTIAARLARGIRTSALAIASLGLLATVRACLPLGLSVLVIGT